MLFCITLPLSAPPCALEYWDDLILVELPTHG